ncbi:discoidin domain-containing protein [Micromonospora tulbaghiae]|uniref:discoidin domain-containing protein n=1 Tax=Micromonospora tulbaghiae TaxID=479978 RepID=UPI0033D6D24B
MHHAQSPPGPRSRRRPLATVLVAGLTAGALATPGGPPPAAAAPPSDPAYVNASGQVFPGVQPGPATVSLSGGSFTLANAALSATWNLSGSTVSLTRFDNRAANRTVPMSLRGLFTLTLADGTTITPANMTVTAAPALGDLPADAASARLAGRYAGKAVTTTFRYASGGRTLEVQWQVRLRGGANSVQHSFTVRSVAGTFDITSLRLVQLSLGEARVMGQDDGSPVVHGAAGSETLFVGIENPMAKPTVSGSDVDIAVARAGDLIQGESWNYTASTGVAPAGQLRRSFQYYVQRERAHDRRTFLHYQSWMDLKPPGLVINSAELTRAVNLFGTQLTNRGARIDSFWVDDGWDYLRAPAVNESNLNVWSFDPTQFPTGFAPQRAAAAQYGASMSVWMSPFGGYGQSASTRTALNASKPAAQQYETHGGGQFKLGGPKYYERFRSVAFDMMDNHGVRGFKFDGIGGGLYQRGPNAGYIADYEALLKLTGDLRAHQKEVFVNATVGTWGSPYWLWFVDSIWRDGDDAYLIGAGTPQQRYVNYRDSETYRNIAVQNPLFPVPSLMNHGIIFSDRTPQFTADHDLTKPSVQAQVSQDIRAYFALGLSLQELYVRNTLVDASRPGAAWFWDTVAANARWARANQGLLSDVRWVGGDPASGAVYGTTAWNSATGASKGMLMLRNPSASAQTFTVNPQTLFELPGGVWQRYRFTERDGLRPGFVVGPAGPTTITLQPFEVAVFEAAPTDEPLGGTTVLSRAGWTASADSVETTGENGNAANAIDGDPATIWHTRYVGGIAGMPHQITLDTRRNHRIDRLDYMPRQDGGTNGIIADYQIQTSADGVTWTQVAAGTFGAGSALKSVSFTPTTARYVRLWTTRATNGAGYASAAEINLYGSVA